MNSQKGFAPVIIIIIVVAMLGIGAGGYVLVSKKRVVPPVTPGAAPETSTETSSESKKNQDAAKNWQVYESKEYKFSVKYPPGFKEHEEKVQNRYIIGFFPKEEESRGLLINIGDTMQSYENTLQEIRISDPTAKESQRNVGSISGREFKTGNERNAAQVAIVFLYQGRVFTLALIFPKVDEESLSVFNLFVSTFTPQVQVPAAGISPTPSPLVVRMEPPKELLGWWEEVEDWSLDSQTGQLKKNDEFLHFFKEFTDKYYCVQYVARDKCIDNVLYSLIGNKIFLEGSSGFYPYAEWRIIDGKLELKGGGGSGKELYIKIGPPTSAGKITPSH